jgi:hypothetical protein
MADQGGRGVIYSVRMIFSENRFPLFGIMRYPPLFPASRPGAGIVAGSATRQGDLLFPAEELPISARY